MFRSCADTARHKIQKATIPFPAEATASNKAELLQALEIMRGKIGTKTPYSFPELSEINAKTAAAFWNQVVAAYCYCQESQRHIVAGTIAQTLDRLKLLLEKENG